MSTHPSPCMPRLAPLPSTGPSVRSHPIAGRVCMDQTMIDLGPQTPSVAVGDEVVLLGRQGAEEIPVEELAELMGTITYEVTSLVARRVERVYSSSSAGTA